MLLATLNAKVKFEKCYSSIVHSCCCRQKYEYSCCDVKPASWLALYIHHTPIINVPHSLLHRLGREGMIIILSYKNSFTIWLFLNIFQSWIDVVIHPVSWKKIFEWNKGNPLERVREKIRQMAMLPSSNSFFRSHTMNLLYSIQFKVLIKDLQT